MRYTGERQVADSLNGIRGDHLGRYEFAAPFVDGLRVLDAACGCGYGAKILSNKAAHVTALDISFEAIVYAREHWRARNVDFKVGDAAKHAGEYDVVVSFETIEHVENAKEVLINFCSQASLLIASVPNEEVLEFRPRNFPHHVRHYTPAQFDELLESSGWRIKNRFTQHHKTEPDVVGGIDGRNLIYICERTQRPN